MLTITTSWDDGHRLDLRVAGLLDRYGLTGTFYIARDYLEERLDEAQLRDLATRHEIGAHTLTHPILTQISLQQAQQEIAGSKQWLEEMLGQAVTAFCYPAGYHNPRLQQLVADAGYSMARIVDDYVTIPTANRFAQATTVQLYPYPLRPLPDVPLPRGMLARAKPLLKSLRQVTRLRLSPRALISWQALAQTLLCKAQQQGGVWHLWGHSWEIERYDLWQQLDAILSTASRLSDYRACTNSQMVE